MFNRIKGIIFVLFGAYILLASVFTLGAEVVRGLSSGTWQFVTFGAAIKAPDLNHAPLFAQWIFGTIFATPWVAVAFVIGAGLLWQGLRAIAYEE